MARRRAKRAGAEAEAETGVPAVVIGLPAVEMAARGARGVREEWPRLGRGEALREREATGVEY
jgi:hypothetical protein